MYEFKPDDAYEFQRKVGVYATRRGSELLFRSCPYCKGGSGKDKNTFSINLTTGQFECFRSSCGVKGNMITLSRDFDFSISEEVDRYINRNNHNQKFKSFKPTPQIESKDRAIEYCAKRGISEATCRKFELTTYKDKNNVLVFPFRNDKQELKFFKYRNMDYVKGQTQGSKEWCEKDCMPILFGMSQCEDFERLVMTEGQLDSLSCAEAGIKNAVSVPTGCNGFTWIPHCWDWLVQFKELVIFGDCENGKITLADVMTKRFPNKVSIVRVEDYKGCKDANEILQKFGKMALVEAVDHAEPVPDVQIKKLSDVEAIDILNTEAIPTDITELDKILSGGMHIGQLILLTGKRGEGKSTFMSQLIANATDHDYKTFVYSGELVDFYFKRWLDMQISGKSVLRNSEIDKINAWYDNKIFLYDNNIIDTDEMKDLITIVETAIRKHECKFICIDNLMTAMDVASNDNLYRAQSQFVGKLARIAKLHNVVVLLVAHPRKTSMRFENDDVSGSADITNRVDIVMNYSRTGSEDLEERDLMITKNRLTGEVTRKNEEIKLYYSSESKRIVGKNKDFTRHYGWETDPDNFASLYGIEEQVEMPF